MVHALGRLAGAGFYEPSLDLAAIAGGLHEARWFRRTKRGRARR
jgi:hypothetical protein